MINIPKKLINLLNEKLSKFSILILLLITFSLLFSSTCWGEWSKVISTSHGDDWYVDREKIKVQKAFLPCGHYTGGRPPFSYLTGYHLIKFFRKERKAFLRKQLVENQ